MLGGKAPSDRIPDPRVTDAILGHTYRPLSLVMQTGMAFTFGIKLRHTQKEEGDRLHLALLPIEPCSPSLAVRMVPPGGK